MLKSKKKMIVLFCMINSCENNDNNEKNSTIQWKTADKNDLTWGSKYNGTHQFIANNSFNFVEQTYILEPSTENLFYQKLLLNFKKYKQFLILSSDLPDKIENDPLAGIPTFVGHFYNPDTGRNYRGRKSPTAYTRTLEHSKNAIKYLKIFLFSKNKEYNLKYIELAAKEIGMSIHYISDACESHHATNRLAYLSWHTQYENYVNKKIKANPKNFTLTSPSIKYSDDFGSFVHNCAVYSKKFSNIIKENGYCFDVNCSNYEQWEYAASQTIKEAQNQSAGYLASILLYSAINAENDIK